MARRMPISGSRRSVTGEARKALQIEGLEEIQDRLAAIMNGVTGRQVKDVYYAAGRRLRDRARANAPYDTGRKKGTHLRDAIFVDRGDGNKPNVLVGVRYFPNGAPHAHLVEYGSARNSGHPYMRPAIAQEAAAIASDIKQGLLKIIEDAVK